MPKKKLKPSEKRTKRIAISLNDADYDALKRFSEASGKPMSSIVNEAFKEMIPSFKKLTEALELANKKKEGVFDKLGQITAENMKKTHHANLLLSGAVSDALLNDDSEAK